MEEAKGQPQTQQKPPAPMRCPRCGSFDTKFDYFNNHRLAQPRHHCRTCKRQWTVGGRVRNIPLGANSRSISKQTKASSSRTQTPQTAFTTGEECLQDAQILPPTEARVPQNFDAAMTQPVTNLPEVGFPLSSCYCNCEHPCANSMQYLIQPQVINQHVAYGSQSSRVGGNKGIPEECKIQDTPSQQVLPQHIPINDEPYQLHNQANDVTPYYLCNSNLVQPGHPENSLPQEVPNDFNFSTSDPSICNDFMGNSTEPEEDTSSVNVDEWLSLSDHSTP